MRRYIGVGYDRALAFNMISKRGVLQHGINEGSLRILAQDIILSHKK